MFAVDFCIACVIMDAIPSGFLGCQIGFSCHHPLFRWARDILPEGAGAWRKWGLETVQDRWRHICRDIDIIRFVVSCGALTDEQRGDLSWKDCIRPDWSTMRQPEVAEKVELNCGIVRVFVVIFTTKKFHIQRWHIYGEYNVVHWYISANASCLKGLFRISVVKAVMAPITKTKV